MSYSDTNLSNTATRHHRIQRFERSESHRSTLQDVLADEAPVAIQYNGINHVVMLASAIDLIDLAYGFSYTEGIIRQPSDIYDCQIHPASNGLILDITIASACLQQLKLKRRRMTGQTGCGLCGIESLAALEHDFNPLPQGVVALSTEAIDKALNQ